MATETVRRDLKVLEEHGLVRRTHGGAYPTDGAAFETNMTHRSGHRVPEKRRIALAAAENLGDAETIYLDEGFTPQLVADELIKLQRPFTVVTASLSVAGLLAPVETMSVILLGGRVRGRTLGTVDYWATNMLSDLVIDLAVLGTNGISRDRGSDHARSGGVGGETQGGRGFPAPAVRRHPHQVRHPQLLQVRRRR